MTEILSGRREINSLTATLFLFFFVSVRELTFDIVDIVAGDDK